MLDVGGHARRLADVGAEDLESWADAGWLLPSSRAARIRFSAVDLARARLIRDLKRDIGVNDDGIAVVLDLLDQIHGLRRLLNEMMSAVSLQSAATQRQIAADARRMAQLNRARSRSRRESAGL